MIRVRHSFSLTIHALVIASLLFVWVGTQGFAAPKKFDTNTAMEEELARVPGISKELAQLIVEYREGNGEIESWADVRALQQDADLRKLEKHLTGGEESGEN
jgi:hypothetical protein